MVGFRHLNPAVLGTLMIRSQLLNQQQIGRLAALRRREDFIPHGSGRNGRKRIRRAAIATLKGCPGGWKKAVRLIDAEERRLERQ